MTGEKSNESKWLGIFPRERSVAVSIVVIAVVAFIFGGLFLGGGTPADSTQDDPAGSSSDASGGILDTIWTCSMHPQIRMHKPGKCPICFMDLIPVNASGNDEELDPNQIRLSKTAMQLANIQTSRVTRAYAARSVRMVGKLDYDETRVSYITAWVPGRLDSLFVDYTGAVVSKGDRMALMYSPELVAGREELLQAKRAVAALHNASSDVLKSTAKATLKSAREKLRLYGLSENQIATPGSDSTFSEHVTLSAPSGGVVIHKDATQGMYVSTGAKIYTIADLKILWVVLRAYESDLPWLRNGQHVTFTSPSFPGEKFDAKINFIDPVVDPATRTVEVRAEVDNADGRLKPEMFVSAVVQSRLDAGGNVVSSTPDGPAPLLVPASAPLLTGQRAIVYIEIPGDNGSVFEGREVTLGPRAGDFYVVKDGLKEGELVVTNSAFKIDSELQIEAKPSMMSPEGGAVAATEHHHVETVPAAVVVPEKPKEYKAGTAKRLDNCVEAQQALKPVYKTYFEVQMALANDDLQGAKKASGALVQAITDVNMELFKGKAHARWMEISTWLEASAESGKNAENIVDARDYFFHLSQAAIELHDTFGHAGDSTYYLTFCPMARDKAGAWWLQTADTVWNSFYGEKMLRCGEIKQPLPSGDKVTE